MGVVAVHTSLWPHRQPLVDAVQVGGLMAGPTEFGRLGIQQVVARADMGCVAGETGLLCGGMAVGQGDPFGDGRMAGKAERLGLLFEEELAARVVGAVAGEAFAFRRETMGCCLSVPLLQFFVADGAEGAPARSMEDIRVGAAVVLMAPLATAFPQRLVGGGGVHEFGCRCVALDTGPASGRCGQTGQSGPHCHQQKHGDESPSKKIHDL